MPEISAAAEQVSPAVRLRWLRPPGGHFGASAIAEAARQLAGQLPRGARAILVTLGVGTVLAGCAGLLTARYALQLQRLEFAAQAQTEVSLVQFGVDRYVDALWDLKALIIAAHGKPEHATFDAVAARMAERLPGIQALEWVPRVQHDAREAYEAAARRVGFGDFRFTEISSGGARITAGSRAVYYPAYYVFPATGNEAAIGYDLGSEPVRRATLETARDNDAPAATDKVRLVQPIANDTALLMFVPVYDPALPHGTLDERRRSLAGLVLGIFRIGSMIEEILSRASMPADFDMAVYDHPGGAGERLLYSRFVQPGQRTARLAMPGPGRAAVWQGALRVADRRWEVAAQPGIPVAPAWLPAAAFAAVMLITLMATGQVAASRRRSAERAAAARRRRASLEQTIRAIASTVEARDPYTAGHQHRVAALAAAMAAEMGLPQGEREGIAFAASLHDVGAIQVPTEILCKPGPLSPVERRLMQTHAQAGYDIVKGVDFPWPIADLILQHHERLDGSGYPNGLRGEEMLRGARILAVADVVEAMTALRPYRAAFGLEAALAEIEAGKGRLYDAAAVDACLALFRQRGFALPPAAADA